MEKIYLDNAATSWPKPREVINETIRFYNEIGCSPGRGGYECALMAGREVLETRTKVAAFFGSSQPENVCFTYNVTYALNIALKGLLKKRDHVLTSDMEHNAVWRPLKQLEKDKEIEITSVPFLREDVSLEELLCKIKENTRVVVLNHASNVTGDYIQIEEMARALKDRNIFFVLDAAQSAGVIPINLASHDVDVLAFTGHKSLFGPPGVGGLLLSSKVVEKIAPSIQGGTGSISDKEIQPDFMPDKLESGTPNTPGLMGLKAGIDFINNEGFDKIADYKKKITRILADKLEEIPGVKLEGKTNKNFVIPVVSITIKDRDLGEISYELGEEGVLVRSGLHCSPVAHRAIGTFPEGTIRFSPGYFTTEKEIDLTVEKLKKILKTK